MAEMFIVMTVAHPVSLPALATEGSGSISQGTRIALAALSP